MTDSIVQAIARIIAMANYSDYNYKMQEATYKQQSSREQSVHSWMPLVW